MRFLKAVLITLTVAVPTIGAKVASNAVPSVMPVFAKSCIGYCDSCTNPEYMFYTLASNHFISLLGGYASCAEQVLGPCSTFGNCDPVDVEGTAALTEDVRRDLWLAAKVGDVQVIRTLIQEYPTVIQFNEARSAVQVFNCDGVGILMSAPASLRVTVALAD